MKHPSNKQTIQLTQAEVMWLDMVVENILKCDNETDITKHKIFYDHIKWGAWILKNKIDVNYFFDDAELKQKAENDIYWLERVMELEKEGEHFQADVERWHAWYQDAEEELKDVKERIKNDETYIDALKDESFRKDKEIEALKIKIEKLKLLITDLQYQYDVGWIDGSEHERRNNFE